jgi:serine/threonine-protein phosphatase 2A regulatory subunit B'
LIPDPKNVKKDRTKIEDKWRALTQQAASKNPSFKEPVLPYIDSHIVGEHNGLNNGNVVIS